MPRDRSRADYDRDEVRRRAEEIVCHYLGPAKRQGDARSIWKCPACGGDDKYAVRRQDQLAGCFKDDCRLGGGADVFTFIAFHEDLDTDTQFVEVLKRGYEALGLTSGPAASENGEPDKRKTQAPAAGEKQPKPSPRETKRRLELVRRVNARVMALSPLEPRDRKYLRGRGLTHETIDAGRFGSMSAERARHLKRVLLEEFGDEVLLSVPGFFTDEPSGRLGFTLTGDYLLIPYHDRDGNVTNVEGRTTGEIPKGMGKYVSLRGSGNHLYLFPSFASAPGEIVALPKAPSGR